MRALHKLYIIVGISIIIGFVVGVIFSEYHYYYLKPSKGKKEITYVVYKDMQNEKVKFLDENSSGTYARWTTKKWCFNYEFALISTFLSIGILLFFNGYYFFKKE